MFKSTGRPRRMGHAPTQKVERPVREVVTKSATISVDGADRILPCTVRDISKTGARVSITNPAAVPQTLLLIIRSENLVARARVVWRKVNEIGVQFLRSGGMELEERMKREQAAAHAKMLHAIAQQQQEEAARQHRIAQEQAAQKWHIQQECLRLMVSINMDPVQGLDEESLKLAYRKEAMRRHPDQGGTMDAFQELNKVYKALMSAIMDGNVPPPGMMMEAPAAPQQAPAAQPPLNPTAQNTHPVQPHPPAAHQGAADAVSKQDHTAPAPGHAEAGQTISAPIRQGLPRRPAAPRPAGDLSPLDAFHADRTG
ncbi:MAG: PilZ domain-containing protein [Pseudomonadota bacterium]